MSAAMKLDAERASFEAEYGPRDGFSWRNEDGSYKIASLQLAWEIWQKRAALDTSTPPQGELSALPELPWGEDIEAWMEVRSGSEIAEAVRAYGLLCRQSGDATDKRDAERYRWLRMQEWFDGPMCVLREPKRVLSQGIGLGADCPSRERLDAAIDAAIAQRQEGGE